MNDAEKALLANLSVETKAALKDLLKEVADIELPKLLAVEEQRLPAYAQPLAAGVVGLLYPQLQALLDAKIDSL